MNHVSGTFKSIINLNYSYWERAHGAYSNIALVFHNSFFTMKSDSRLLDCLLEHKFKIVCPDIQTLMENAKNPVEAMKILADFIKDLSEKEGKQITVFAESIFAIPAFETILRYGIKIKGFAFLSPFWNFKESPFAGWLFFKSFVNKTFQQEALTGNPLELEEITGTIKQETHVRTSWIQYFRKESDTLAQKLKSFSHDHSCAVFAGEEAPCLKDNLLAGTDIKLFTYPRVMHLVVYDRYWKNVQIDIDKWLSSLK